MNLPRLLPLVLTAAIAMQAHAETAPAEAARAAAAQLEAASITLQEADGARDRVTALTGTVQAYEAGLAAMRDGLRRASLRERQLASALKAREDDVAQLLAVLQTMGQAPAPTLLLHPSGPTGTARSGMILTDVMPALKARAEALRRDLDEVSLLRELQEGAVARLQNGLSGVQQARTKLSQAIADRTDLPHRFFEDPVKTALLIASTETLEGFASGLAEIPDGRETPIELPDITLRKGSLQLPVQARVLRRFQEEDAAGIRRPGLVLATRPNALVITPAAATIRYRGPLLDYGNVVILEPKPGVLFVLAGLETVFGNTGEVLPEGSAVGLMGGNDPEIGAILSQTSDGTGTDRSETLYIEVRQGKTPVDPETWFRTN